MGKHIRCEGRKKAKMLEAAVIRLLAFVPKVSLAVVSSLCGNNNFSGPRLLLPCCPLCSFLLLIIIMQLARVVRQKLNGFLHAGIRDCLDEGQGVCAINYLACTVQRRSGNPNPGADEGQEKLYRLQPLAAAESTEKSYSVFNVSSEMDAELDLVRLENALQRDLFPAVEAGALVLGEDAQQLSKIDSNSSWMIWVGLVALQLKIDSKEADVVFDALRTLH